MASTSLASASLWNAGNWMWESKSFAKLSESEIRERLLSIEMEGGGVLVKVVEVLKLKADASLHVRRGKRMATFDISFTARWEGWKAGEARPTQTPSGKQAAGEVTVTDIMQDDVGEDFAVNVYMSSVSGVNAVDLRSKDTAKAGLPIAIRAQLRSFASQLAKLASDADTAAAEKAQREEEVKKTATANANVTAQAERQRLTVEQSARLERTAAAVSSVVVPEKQAAAAIRAAGQAAQHASATAGADGVLALPTPLKVEAAGAAPEVKPSEWNTGAWAWETRDLSTWAHTKLQELLSHVEMDVPPVTNDNGRIVQPGAFLRTIKPDTLKVEASVSLRKGKKLLLFEVTAELPWEGNLVGQDGKALGTGDGVIRVADLDQDSLHDGEYTFLAVPDEEGGEMDAQLAGIMQRHGVPLLKKKLLAFAQELTAEAGQA